MEKITGYLPVVKNKVSLEARTRDVCITTPSLNTLGQVIIPSGCDLSHFLKNPVVLFGHRLDILPVGKGVDVQIKKNGIFATTIYNLTPLAEQILTLSNNGFPLAISIGFKITNGVWSGDRDFQRELDACVKNGWVGKEEIPLVRVIVKNWQLLEYSDVPAGANPDAIQMSLENGLINLNSIYGKGNANMNKNSGAVLSAENLKSLQNALDHHAEVAKCINAVIAAHTGAEPDGDEGGEEQNAPTMTVAEFKSTVESLIAAKTNAIVEGATKELMTMFAKATGRHIEL